MSVLIVILILTLSSALLVTTFRRLRRRHVGRVWWLAFGSLTVVGAVLGSWLAFNFEYQISTTLRFASFPVLLCCFKLEDGHWTDFPAPPFVMYPGLMANILAVTAIAVLPVLGASLLSHRREKV